MNYLAITKRIHIKSPKSTITTIYLGLAYINLAIYQPQRFARNSSTINIIYLIRTIALDA